MDFTSTLLSILSIHLMASISPGPDFVVVSQRALFQGRKAGMICGLGVCVGLVFHITYSVIGLTTAMSNSALLTQAIGFLGGCYLIFLGYSSIKASFLQGTEISHNKKNYISEKSAFLSGFTVNIFNPKAAVYFISLFSMVTVSSMEVGKILLIALLIILVQMAWYLIFVFIITIPAFKVKFDSKIHFIERLLGILMLMMGAYMLYALIP